MSAVPNKALHLTSGAGNRTPLAGERQCSAHVRSGAAASRGEGTATDSALRWACGRRVVSRPGGTGDGPAGSRPTTARPTGCHGPCFPKSKGRATLRSYPQGRSFVNALAGSYWLPGDQEPCVLPCSGRGVSPARQHYAGFMEAHSRKANEASRGGPTDDRPASPTKASRGRRSSSVAPCRKGAVPNKALHLTSGAGILDAARR